MEEAEQTNRRAHIRFALPVPVFAELSLSRVEGKPVTSRATRIMLDDISYGGGKFRTYLDIPAREDVEWRMKTQIGNYEAQLTAIVVRRERDDGLFVYGAYWKLSEFERMSFQYKLNEYLRAVLVLSPHILTLYSLICKRNGDDHFRKLDITS